MTMWTIINVDMNSHYFTADTGFGADFSNPGDIISWSEFSERVYTETLSTLPTTTKREISLAKAIDVGQNLIVAGTTKLTDNVGIGKDPTGHGLDVNNTINCTGMFVNGSAKKLIATLPCAKCNHLCSINITGLLSLMELIMSPFASLGKDGITTFKPGI